MQIDRRGEVLVPLEREGAERVHPLERREVVDLQVGVQAEDGRVDEELCTLEARDGGVLRDALHPAGHCGEFGLGDRRGGVALELVLVEARLEVRVGDDVGVAGCRPRCGGDEGAGDGCRAEQGRCGQCPSASGEVGHGGAPSLSDGVFIDRTVASSAFREAARAADQAIT
ncbi:hypothetical protein PLANTIT3_50003 [Plantibacter sp. T3]|nr:hypothetical protein PLANTIT3_50003 [Plantibacter sp. T3]